MDSKGRLTRTESAARNEANERSERSTEPAAEDREKDDVTPVELSKDDVFELLKNQRRRYVLEYLAEEEESVRLRDLAEQIAAWENDKPIREITSDERKRVYVGLYQCHLTKMDEVGVVEFDQDRGTIRRSEPADQLYGYLDRAADEGGADWSNRYLGVTAASGALIVAATAGLLPLVLAAVLTTASFGSLALAQKFATVAPDLGRLRGN